MSNKQKSVEASVATMFRKRKKQSRLVSSSKGLRTDYGRDNIKLKRKLQKYVAQHQRPPFTQSELDSLRSITVTNDSHIFSQGSNFEEDDYDPYGQV